MTDQAQISLTYQQKLDAISLRFYQGMKWVPKAGDYYTTSRADLELYQVVSVDGDCVKTRYCDTHKSAAISSWPANEFTDAGFGPKRVWVPNFVLTAQAPAPAPDKVARLVEALLLSRGYIADVIEDMQPTGDVGRMMRRDLMTVDAALAALIDKKDTPND